MRLKLVEMITQKREKSSLRQNCLDRAAAVRGIANSHDTMRSNTEHSIGNIQERSIKLERKNLKEKNRQQEQTKNDTSR